MSEQRQSDKPSMGSIQKADTVPPPASGDVYNAATEVRAAPEDLLDIMRQVKEKRAAKQSGASQPQDEAGDELRLPPPGAMPDLDALLGGKAPASKAKLEDAPASPPKEPSAPVVAPPQAQAPAEPAQAAAWPVAPSDAPLEYPGAARRQRVLRTMVRVLWVALVVVVVFVAVSITMASRAPAP
jgi:uncharacterized membrane protein